MKPAASIIITSFNQGTTLEFLFESLSRQTRMDFEAVIADDGSSDHTAELCQKRWPFPVQFVTQPDDGYRKSKIVNEAIRHTKSDYFIFLDGDVILERHFVEDHLRLRRPGYFVCGRRVDLGPEFTKNLKVDDVRCGRFDRFQWPLLVSTLKKDTQHFNRSLRVTNPLIRKIFKYDKEIDILGSNFSTWKSDVIAVNGFNEELESYWGEDGDLYIRLRNTGKKPIGAKAICVQFHIFHKRRTPTKENEARFQRLLKDFTYVWAPKGLVETRTDPAKVSTASPVVEKNSFRPRQPE